jgi:multidrug resistance efflux pump
MAIKKRTGKKALVVFATAGALTVACAAYFVATRSGSSVPEIEAYTVTAGTVEREVSANGVIGARDAETLVSQASGAVVKLPVKKGDAVVPGQLIALLDRERILAQEKEAAAALAAARRGVRVDLLRLRTSYVQAKAEWEQADRDYATAKELADSGSVSEAELTRAADRRTVAANGLTAARQSLNLREGRPKDDPQTAAAPPDDRIVEESEEVRQAVAQLEAADSALRQTEIRCTIAGVVTELPVEAGSVVAPGVKVAVVADPRRLEVTSNIDEVDIGYVSAGQQARIESDVFLDRQLSGRVTEIAPSIARVGDARVCEITVGFDDPGRLAKIGASCSIYITVARRENVPVLPLELYLQEGKKKYVFKLVKEGAVPGEYALRKTEIETGVLGLDKIEVVRGLGLGDRIARGQLKSFRDGQKVKVTPEETPAGDGAASGNGQ